MSLENSVKQLVNRLKHIFLSRHGFLSFISILFFVYIITLKPFDLQKDNNFYIYSIIYTLISFVVMELNYFFISKVEKYFNDEFYLITKYGTYISLNIIGYSFFMWFFYVLVNDNPALSIIDFFVENFVFSVLPIMLFLIFMQSIILQKHEDEAIVLTDKLNRINIEEQPEVISIETDSVKGFFQQPINQIICIEANDNYSAVFFQTNDGRVNREMLRVTLKNVEDQFKQYSQMMRCHKSYIVNIKKIEKVNGNAQGYRLKMQSVDFEIPVSRRFPREILNSIKKTNII